MNSGFDHFTFSSEINIFPNENLKTFFIEGNSTETSFDEVDHPVSINSKYYDINDYNNLTSNTPSTLKWKHFDVSHDLLDHYFSIIEISEHKISKNPNNINFNLAGYAFCYNELESSHGGSSDL